MKYPAVINVHPQDNFILHLAFDNRENVLFDMKPYLEFGIFSRIKHPDSFAKVKVSFDTIEWESGADLDPEFVYSKCRKINKAIKEHDFTKGTDDLLPAIVQNAVALTN